MSRYIPLLWADSKSTVSLQSADNGTIEIQCCQVNNKHTHKSRYESDIAQKTVGSMTLRRKQDKCNKFWRNLPK